MLVNDVKGMLLLVIEGINGIVFGSCVGIDVVFNYLCSDLWLV